MNQEYNNIQLLCVRCGKPVNKNKENYETFEKMHWICFHLEYEHMTDPDEPCEDASCPLLQLRILKRKLNDLGYKPEEIIHKAIWE